MDKSMFKQMKFQVHVEFLINFGLGLKERILKL